MGLGFTVLASGSSGNATLVQVDEYGMLIDAGLGPRQLAARLKAVGLSMDDIHAVLLTHTHSDHWKDTTLAAFARRRVPVYCHAEHHTVLRTYSNTFLVLLKADLVRSFEAGADFVPTPGLRCRPLPVRHDGGATFGFRLEAAADLFGQGLALAYVADLGCWDDELAAALADVDLLAVEFNHDVPMQYASGRWPRLIARILGDDGHLSNEQAAALVRAVLAKSPAGRLRHLVQLHLSRECNHPDLARAAATAVRDAHPAPFEIHTARQDAPCATLRLGAADGEVVNGKPPALPRRPRPRRAAPHEGGWLPGLGDASPSPGRER
jgi:phosphoribosyl 1,2-cyclic phosphodiesterase